jgi:hypothetical protein
MASQAAAKEAREDAGGSRSVSAAAQRLSRRLGRA